MAAMVLQDFQQQLGVERIVFRTRAVEGCPQCGERLRSKRINHELLELQQHRHHRAVALFQTNRDRRRAEAGDQLGGPATDRLRGVVEEAALALAGCCLFGERRRVFCRPNPVPRRRRKRARKRCLPGDNLLQGEQWNQKQPTSGLGFRESLIVESSERISEFRERIWDTI